MNGIVITPKGEIRRADFQDPIIENIEKELGGWMEIVRPKRLGKPYAMLVNDDFIRLGLPINRVGCYLYGTDEHGAPIRGNIIIVVEDGEFKDLEQFELSTIEGYARLIHQQYNK